MTIHFIGAGPGAADLITVRGRDLRGRDLMARCPVCLYAGSIVPAETAALATAGPMAHPPRPLTRALARGREEE